MLISFFLFFFLLILKKRRREGFEIEIAYFHTLVLKKKIDITKLYDTVARREKDNKVCKQGEKK